MKKYISFALLLILAACTGRRKPERLLPPEPVVIEHEGATGRQDKPLPFWAQTKGDAVNKIGKPYKVNGVWYFPAENPTYDEIGLAAIYSRHFKGKRTANGEIYEEGKLTACHKTLPLPSIVRVTNLENNKSTTVRINDRGPFVNDRLVDVSPRVAEMLQFQVGQPTKVRVEVLKNETSSARDLINQPVETAVEPAPQENAPTAGPVTASEESAPASEDDGDVINVLEASQEDGADSQDSVPVSVNAADDTAAPEVNNVPATPAPSDSDQGAPVEQLIPPSNDVFYVQAGVFGNKKNADRLAKKLVDTGDVQKTSFDAQGRTLTRVRVGPFSSLGSADRALQQVKGLGVDDARITTDRVT